MLKGRSYLVGGKEMTAAQLIRAVRAHKREIEAKWRRVGWEAATPCNNELSTIDDLVEKLAEKQQELSPDEFKRKCLVDVRV
jgi:hypothetical protein